MNMFMRINRSLYQARGSGLRVACRHMAALLALIFVPLVLASCQNPTEPDATIPSVKVTVRVEDQSKEPIESAAVAFRRDLAQTLIPFGPNGRTGSDGTTTQVFDIPANGQRLLFTVTPPATVEFDTSAAIRDSAVVVGCRDSVYVFTLPRLLSVPCNQALPDQNLHLQLCAAVTPRDTICTRRISLLCPAPIGISVQPAQLGFPGATLLMRRNGADQPIGTSSVTLNSATDNCEICMIYAAQAGLANASRTVSVTASPAAGAPYRLLDVNFSAETTCDSCSCQGSRTVDAPPQTVCVGASTDFSVNLSAIRNSAGSCDLIFTPERLPQAGGLRVVSFNNGRTTLGPSEALTTMRLTAAPTAPGTFADSAVYRMTTRSRSGNTAQCGTLTVRFRLDAVGPTCPLVLSGSLVDPADSTRAIPLTADVCSSASGTVCMNNTGAQCPLEITGVRLVGGDVTQFDISVPSGPPLSIPTRDSACIKVTFKPTAAYYLASGTPPRRDYATTLEITSQCGRRLVPIAGHIPDPRVPPLRLFPTGCIVNPNTGIRLMDDGSINIDQVARSSYLITVQSINAAAPRSAVLVISTPYKFLRTGLSDATPLCSLRDDPATLPGCNSATAGGPVVVREGDVYVFHYVFNGCDFCALLWVEAIDDVSPTRTCPQVQFRICSPIVH